MSPPLLKDIQESEAGDSAEFDAIHDHVEDGDIVDMKPVRLLGLTMFGDGKTSPGKLRATSVRR
jgi:hypothetical protein